MTALVTNEGGEGTLPCTVRHTGCYHIRRKRMKRRIFSLFVSPLLWLDYRDFFNSGLIKINLAVSLFFCPDNCVLMLIKILV